MTFIDRAKPHRAAYSHLCCFCLMVINKGSLYLRDGDACAHVECAEERAGRRYGESENQMKLFEEETR